MSPRLYLHCSEKYPDCVSTNYTKMTPDYCAILQESFIESIIHNCYRIRSDYKMHIIDNYTPVGVPFYVITGT